MKVAALLALLIAALPCAHAQNELPATPNPRSLGEAAGLYAGAIEYLNVIKASDCGPVLRREVPTTSQAIQSDILPRFPASARGEVIQTLNGLRGEMRRRGEQTLSVTYQHYTQNEGYGPEAACAAIVTSATSLRKLTFEAMERFTGASAYEPPPQAAKPASKPMRNPFADANHAECLLSKLPGTANDVAANAIIQTCQAEHPGGLAAVEQGAGRGMLGYKTGAECTAKKAGDTRSNRAAHMIGVACRKLYDEPVPWDDFELVAPPQKLIPYHGPILPLEPSPK